VTLLSLCTWCREWPPLREALPANLATVAGLDWVEVCVVDVGSRDDTVEWLRSLAAENPQLRVTSQPLEPLHFAAAYNLCHHFATGKILASVDADNVIGPDYCRFVRNAVAADPLAIVHCWTGDWLDGTCGRLALHRNLFDQLGGYDEALERIGNQDLDLRDRAQAAGGRCVLCQDPAVVGHAIFTRHEDKMQHLAGVDYARANQVNARISNANLARGRLRANQGP
jgi:glycosyltransferase involved in cell wall biosynthesis